MTNQPGGKSTEWNERIPGAGMKHDGKLVSPKDISLGGGVLKEINFN